MAQGQAAPAAGQVAGLSHTTVPRGCGARTRSPWLRLAPGSCRLVPSHARGQRLEELLPTGTVISSLTERVCAYACESL